MNINIGVLAIQGAFVEHEVMLHKCLQENGDVLGHLINLQVTKVTEAGQVASLDGLIIPGGESTVISRIIDDEMLQALSSWSKNDRHILLGTCAGLIVLSKNLTNTMEGQIGRLSQLSMFDVTTSRNYFGRQLNSFEGEVVIKEKAVSASVTKNGYNTPNYCNGVFIRAPAVLSIDNSAVKTIATIQVNNQEVIVGIQQKNGIGLAFHPKLTEDLRWHSYFLKTVMEKKLAKHD